MYDARKTELHAQQKKIEDDHLQILKTQAEHDTVDFRQKMLHDKQGLEKQLLQEVLLRYLYLYIYYYYYYYYHHYYYYYLHLSMYLLILESVIFFITLSIYTVTR